MASSEPVVVLFKSANCHHCRTLSSIWDKVSAGIKEVYPKLRFFIATAKDNTGQFDPNKVPKDLSRFGKWFPTILLVPGRVWDDAMEKLGPTNKSPIRDGVQVMNAVWNKDNIEYKQKYDIRRPEDFVKWVKEAFENEEFKRVQNEIPKQKKIQNEISSRPLIVPTVDNSSQSISPMMSKIIRPDNTKTNYVTTENNERKFFMEPIGDICSMRIIPRPSTK